MTEAPSGRVVVSGRPRPLPAAVVIAVVESVLRGEKREGRVEVAFVGRDRMAKLNQRWKGVSRPTDVLAFPLHPEGNPVLGDVYICPWVASRSATRHGVSLREELIRLVVHGTLHVLGWDHPEGEERTSSPMWKRQETYVDRVR